MAKHLINYCVNVITDWMDENPSLSWCNIWSDLEDCLRKSVTKADRLKIKQALANKDYY